MESIVTGAAIVLGTTWELLSTHHLLEPSHTHVSQVAPLRLEPCRLRFREVVSSRQGHTISKQGRLVLTFS